MAELQGGGVGRLINSRAGESLELHCCGIGEKQLGEAAWRD